MTQVPLAPPPQTGGPIDGWLYLLWQRVTAVGQILWSSIVPGTSADVAAVVTDETGSPGSLVFSANPRLTGVTVDGIFYQGDTTAMGGVDLLGGMFSSNTAVGSILNFRKSCTAINGPQNLFLKSRGTAAIPSAITAGDFLGSFGFYGYDGSAYSRGALIQVVSEGTISSGVVRANISFWTANSAGTAAEGFRIDKDKVITLGGDNATPALKVTPVASQARWVEVTGATSSGNPALSASGGSLSITSVLLPKQATTAGAPSYVLGGVYFDTTMNKLRMGGASVWETLQKEITVAASAPSSPAVNDLWYDIS